MNFVPFFFYSTSNLMDVSLKDWDLKEQEGLRQVEEMLDRADVILEVRYQLFQLGKQLLV